jgi:hypothetical protein
VDYAYLLRKVTCCTRCEGLDRTPYGPDLAIPERVSFEQVLIFVSVVSKYFNYVTFLEDLLLKMSIVVLKVVAVPVFLRNFVKQLRARLDGFTTLKTTIDRFISCIYFMVCPAFL